MVLSLSQYLQLLHVHVHYTIISHYSWRAYYLYLQVNGQHIFTSQFPNKYIQTL